MTYLAVERERLNGPMGTKKDGSAWGLVAASRLHSNVAVFYKVKTTHAMLSAKLIKRVKQFVRFLFFAVNGNQVTLYKIQTNLLRLCGSLIDGYREPPHTCFGWRPIRVFKQATLVRNVQQVGIH